LDPDKTNPDIDSSFTLDAAALARNKAERAWRVYRLQIPALRATGFAMLCVFALLQGWQRDHAFAQGPVRWLIAGNLLYVVATGLLLWWPARRRGDEALNIALFHVDLLPWLANLYVLEAGNLFWAFFLMARVIDQVGFGFRRAFYFGHVVTLAYAAYALWAAQFVPQRADALDRINITVTLYLVALYIALIGMVTERLRARTRRAVLAARELVDSLAQKAEALESQTTELRRARELAEQASLAKSQFLAVTSHEIRTPLNGILGTAELLMGTSLTRTQQRYVRTAQQSATSLLALIEDVLDLSRIEAGKLTLNPLSVDLRALAGEAIELIGVTARDKPVDVVSQLAADLPERVLADPLRLRQLLLNLLHNAVKFTDRGTVRLELTVMQRHDEGLRLRVAVIDTGVGIAQQQLGSIFDAFTQADASPTRRHGGSGLGLTIVRELAELMHGEVRVQSRLGEGSTFEVELPLRVLAAPPGASAGRDDDRDHDRLRVLVAEDDPVNQMVVEEMLKLLGCSVVVTGDGEAACAAALADDYDIVFMDCHMPVLDGYEATRRIRAAESRQGRRTPIVALTADAMANDRERCVAAGMDDFLTKPVSSLQLSITIERWTGRATNRVTVW